eukprot:TRINITY_DN59956_c0_g1_i1.p1 TRINITY_DN59956_c0_g1~~TRINITY_DN59956_c0_g1_i1.p1  ORF type:complete len:448 (+),score=77.13 TRINITY_DN59956_c0_g1_i1:63-1346(+)
MLALGLLLLGAAAGALDAAGLAAALAAVSTEDAVQGVLEKQSTLMPRISRMKSETKTRLLTALAKSQDTERISTLLRTIDGSGASPPAAPPAPLPPTVAGENTRIILNLMRKRHDDMGDDAPWTDQQSPPPKPTIKVVRPPGWKVSQGESLYGGTKEADHVGGWLMNDTKSYEPTIWEFLTRVLGARSAIDIGCGRGHATKWFYEAGLRVLCVEGTEEGIANTVIPDKSRIVQHDYSRGPWWPQEVYDVAWCVEFIEHVEEEYMDNWLATMRSAHYIITSHSRRGGRHHVAIKHDWWWQEKFATRGFTYLPGLSKHIRKMAGYGMPDKAQHYLGSTAMVFRNDWNVRMKPMLGPGSGVQAERCVETYEKLRGTRLLHFACSTAENFVIPWTKLCMALCQKEHGHVVTSTKVHASPSRSRRTQGHSHS